MPATYPKRVSDLPNGSFYALLIPTSITIPGDERSRTNPGHGYPERTECYWAIEAFIDKKEWLERIKHITGRNEVFKAVKITTAEVKTVVEVDVKMD